MRLKHLLLLCGICYCSAAYSQKKQKAVPRPKLVVGLVIDQMRWDYLYRYYDRYSNEGFKRLLNTGFSCENTYIPYIPAQTAIGHSSIYTGSVPAIHGIAGNNWYEQDSGKQRYCTEDSTVKSVGTTSDAGQMSPRNLLASTVTDELKLATNFRSKVIGIALKDRAGILPAGHAADAAYWLDDSTGHWISSTFYMQSLPQWVQNFNQESGAEKYLKKWDTLYPLATYKQSSADNSVRYEATFDGKPAPVFPYDIPALKGKDFGIIRKTPFGITLTLDFAKTAIKNENLGKGEFTDFLAVSISSTDYIGHQFGPNSIEIEDAYLRLDKDIANFLQYLDKAIGKGQYTIFLSADHGGSHNPAFLRDNKIPADFWSISGRSANGLHNLNRMLEDKYKAKKIVRNLYNYQVNFDYSLIKDQKLDFASIKQDVADFYKKQDGVAYVVDVKNIANEPIPHAIKAKIINGYNPKRSGEIQIILNPGWYSGNGPVRPGGSHGTWNPYDAHIPLIFAGWGIKKGKSNEVYQMTDIAPTLSALLKIQEPNGNIGKPITEALKP